MCGSCVPHREHGGELWGLQVEPGATHARAGLAAAGDVLAEGGGEALGGAAGGAVVGGRLARGGGDLAQLAQQRAHVGEQAVQALQLRLELLDGLAEHDVNLVVVHCVVQDLRHRQRACVGFLSREVMLGLRCEIGGGGGACLVLDLLHELVKLAPRCLEAREVHAAEVLLDEGGGREVGGGEHVGEGGAVELDAACACKDTQCGGRVREDAVGARVRAPLFALAPLLAVAAAVIARGAPEYFAESVARVAA